ncbi:MAG: hypothetical protein LBH19_11905 [Dysgonamonadaceae bacterium]|jgi:hypothetical protein|nr:hypothetical protein [Dysgonamonadaceae bacterium]
MKHIFIYILSLIAASAFARQTTNDQPLDKNNPVTFHGDYIIYQGEKKMLNERTFFVDGQLSSAEAAKYPFVFNSFNEAAKHFTNGDETQPMTVYLAPYVYWIDDPDDPAIRVSTGIPNTPLPASMSVPIGLEVKCERLTLFGLTSDPRNVVLACNRGQALGAKGNFTMFSFRGDDLTIENLTMGNYCNVDLEYPLLPKLNRVKRSPTVVQAQLAFCYGDRIMARNTRFISRLDAMPLVGGKRTLFDRCHIECADDALCPTGVYLNTTFTFFSSMPFYRTDGTGAVLLNCDVDLQTRSRQFLTKAGSPVTIVDSRFHNASDTLFLAWTLYPVDDLRCYQSNVTLNGKPVLINADKPWLTVDMTDKPLLSAYRFEHNGEVIYNTYNLLCGDDGWDPMNIKNKVVQAEKDLGISLTEIPTYLHMTPAAATIESGVTNIRLSVEALRFGNYKDHTLNAFQWETTPEGESLMDIKADQQTCIVSGTNNSDEKKTFTVSVVTPLGLEAASVLTIVPQLLEAPVFTSIPKIVDDKKGNLRVEYSLNSEGKADESLITWYRCRDTSGTDAIPVAVTRLNKPEYTYALSEGDVGYYMKVTVAPKHRRSPAGKSETAMTKIITQKQIVWRNLVTDFQNFPVEYQPEKIPGFWTVDGYKPADTVNETWMPQPEASWEYAVGFNGAVGAGLAPQSARGARLLYTPIQKTYGDMSVILNVDPYKAGGQGFSVAGPGQYMDVYIKFDTETLTGYALRINRTLKSDRAVDFYLVKYEHGKTTVISEPVTAVCFRTDCTLTLNTAGNRLTAHAETTTVPLEELPAGLSKTVDLSAEIDPNPFGGTGILYAAAGGSRAGLKESGSTLFHHLEVVWK